MDKNDIKDKNDTCYSISALMRNYIQVISDIFDEHCKVMLEVLVKDMPHIFLDDKE